MEYSFSLEWDELDYDLRERKIDEAIIYNFDNDYLLDDDGEQIYPNLEAALESIECRKSAEDHIRLYFPMYF